MEKELSFTPDTHIAEAGRHIMAAQLDTIQAHGVDLLRDADTTAVHETRKALRRTFTAFKLFRPFFEPGILDDYGRGLKKIMRRLGRSRDITVFLQGLRRFQAESGQNQPESVDSFAELERYWQDQKTAADVNLRLYVNQPQRQTLLNDYAQFTNTPGRGVLARPNPSAPERVRELMSLLIYQRVVAVYDHKDQLAQASMAQLHKLRIQCKDLRYTLEFFAPLLQPEINKAIAVARKLQGHLGKLSDGGIALKMLARTPGRETAVSIYRQAKEREIEQRRSELVPLWHELKAPSWRQKLMAALAVS
jgi:CHAD domain-containing protein